MTIAVDPKKLMGIGSTGGKKPTSHIPAASRAAGAALEGVAGMYAVSYTHLELDRTSRHHRIYRPLP